MPQQEDHHRLFKRCLESAASLYGVRFSELLQSRDVRTFLIDASVQHWPPRILAAKAMATLCCGDRGSMDRAICNAVVHFLDRTAPVPIEDPDGMRRLVEGVQLVGDLRSMSESAKDERCSRWVDRWHP